MYHSRLRTNYLTEFFQAQLTDFVLTGMDKQMHTGMIVVDLQKAFDTLDHEVPLEKLNYFGFRTTATKRFESYFPNRKGSVLGRLLFLLHGHNLPQWLSDAGSYLYTCMHLFSYFLPT